MILLDKYVHGRRPYAVDPASFVVDHRPPAPWQDQNGGTHISAEYWRLSINAIWFRGKVAAPEACFGTLRWSVGEDPRSERVIPGMEQEYWEEDALAAVVAHDDGRYGDDCKAKLRSDGTLWLPNTFSAATALKYERVLSPVLADFPSVPIGYVGWWTFQTGR